MDYFDAPAHRNYFSRKRASLSTFHLRIGFCFLYFFFLLGFLFYSFLRILVKIDAKLARVSVWPSSLFFSSCFTVSYFFYPNTFLFTFARSFPSPLFSSSVFFPLHFACWFSYVSPMLRPLSLLVSRGKTKGQYLELKVLQLGGIKGCINCTITGLVTRVACSQRTKLLIVCTIIHERDTYITISDIHLLYIHIHM